MADIQYYTKQEAINDKFFIAMKKIIENSKVALALGLLVGIAIGYSLVAFLFWLFG